MASFSLRLLLAKLPSFLGSHKTSLDRLTDLSTTCEEIRAYYAAEGDKAASDFWERRLTAVLNALVNCSLMVSLAV